MSKHTPGPWEIAPPHQTTGWGLCIRSSSRILARMVGRDQEQKKADARLMAAAPDLLEALHDCVLVMERELGGLRVIQPELAKARAAITKAEGI